MIAIPNIEKPKKVDGIKIDFHFEDGHIESHIIGIEEIIDIVICGECKQLDQTKWCDLFLHYMNEDDFCSYGERRADGDI